MKSKQAYLPGYDIIEEMETNGLWTFFKAIQQSSKRPVLIKKPASPQDIAAATHEFHMKKNLPIEGILKPYSLEKYRNQALLITEFFKSTSLETILKNKPLDIRTFLTFSIKLTSIVNDLHHHQVIHKNIQPANIFVQMKEKNIKLTGFYHAATLKRENHQSHVNPYVLGRQVAFISPEQTGRLNRFLDHRSDLYSLGVVFYQMLTGKLPFDMEDPIELVHAHIAKTPIPPNSINSAIPRLLSDIVMKLLEKIPQSRYQSAYGLKEDLLEFERRYLLSKAEPSFSLAGKDAPSRSEFGEKLFGRKEAIKTLVQAFENCSKGKHTFALVQGLSGVGKTALINEVQKPLVRKRGYFISGKFDLLKRQVPYAPLVQAFKEILKQILSEGEERVAHWKEKLESELQTYLPTVATILPEIQWIVGGQSEPETLTALETHNRILYSFGKLVHVFANEDHPLVLFLDDLQWADQATLDLLQYIVSQHGKRHLFVIGAYRHNEVTSIHPFQVMLNELKKKEISFLTIALEPLEELHIREWVQHLLSCTEEEAVHLASFIQRITKGNPFFTKQLFQTFYDHKFIIFDENERKWIIDFGQLNNLSIQEDIVAFIAERFYKLPTETQGLLKLASCIGNQFELTVLSAVSNQDESTTAKLLWNALEEGLVLPLSPEYKWIYPDEELQGKEGQPLVYKFLHDKVQQAVYSTMTELEREDSHLTIGRLIASYYKQKNTLEENIFEIVNHFNQCRYRLANEEKIRLAKWNVLAGQRAKEGAAFEASLSFYEMGNELLGDNRWENHYELAAKITVGLGETAYINNQFEFAEELFNEALSKIHSREEKLRIYNLKITLYTHLHRVEEAVDSGLRALKLFGWKLNKRPGKLAVAIEFIQTKIALKNRKAEDLKQLPEMMDEEQRLIMQTFINLNAPAYHVDQNLATMLMLRAFHFTLKYGTSDLTALVYNNYALILSAGFHNYVDSYEFGNLARYYAENSRNSHIIGRTYFVFGSFINHWKNHVMNNEQILEHSQQYCIESGNFHLAGANSPFLCLASFLKGHRLQETADLIQKQLQFSKQIQYTLSKDFLNEVNDWIAVLSGQHKEPNWNFVEILDDESVEIIHYTIRLQLAYLLNEPSVAKRLLSKLSKLVDKSLVLIIAPDYYFYEALWLARNFEETNMKEKRKTLKRIKKTLLLFKRWAGHSPDNYEHKYDLIKAEEARIKKKPTKASLYFEQAVQKAHKNGFNQDEAIANECAGRYYFSRGFYRFAKMYLLAAVRAYEKWGAERKAVQLRKEFADLLSEHLQTKAVAPFSIDLHAIMGAARTLSSEIVLERLIAKLMAIVFKNSGAQKGMMFLTFNGQLQPVAKGSIDEGIRLIKNKAQVDYPQHIIHYVAKSLEPVILSDAAFNGMFTDDNYIRKEKPKSVLCFPILHQGKLVGIVYLENNAMIHAFSVERIEILNILASQAAISIENAFLYENLEMKVKERTEQLETAYGHLEKANQDLAEAEKSRRQFISDISHDLRSPIASVQGYIEAILDGVIDGKEEQMHYLKRSHERLLTLNGMIHDLFELAKLEAKGMSFDMEYLLAHQLFEHLRKQFEHDVMSANLKFGSYIDKASFDNDDPLIEVDIRRIEQVVQNLVSNAIKYTESGEICFQLRFDRQKQEIIFIVKDTGTGIPKDELPFLFDRFYTKPSKRKEGHGLGLAICKGIIEFHHGEITVESEVNIGTSFAFHLPAYVPLKNGPLEQVSLFRLENEGEN
ncbi:ATP-binding sensor histidine kinase [Pueribacillus theae]|uniref:ATP-binding sensor histidine kinase n=1 Tax=Pueribacillus theae TaxID=2171751 RepID=UPI0014028BF7|nr:ATP-binding sensor histidine kinase [Pueribacillus theae]